MLADGAYLYRSGADRSLFIVGDEGVIVTDPINATVAQGYRAAIAEITDAPVRYVVYSHYHWDRVSGGQIFKDEGAEFVAQEHCAERFAANPNAAIVPPDITFDRDYTVSVGDKSLDLHYFGPSHGDCLTVFVAQPAKLIQLVDLVNPPRASFPPDPGVPYVRPHNLRQFFTEVMDLIETLGIREVVASRAIEIERANESTLLSPPLGPAALVASQAGFWNDVYAAVDWAVEQGDVGIDGRVRMKTVDLTRFEPYANYDPDDLQRVMRRFVGFHDMGR